MKVVRALVAAQSAVCSREIKFGLVPRERAACLANGNSRGNCRRGEAILDFVRFAPGKREREVSEAPQESFYRSLCSSGHIERYILLSLPFWEFTELAHFVIHPSC